MSQPTPVNATEVSPQDKSHTRGSPNCLGLVLLSAPKSAVVLVLVRVWNCAKWGVHEVHSRARAAAVSPNDRAAWDDADDNLLESSVFLLQRMFSGFGFVGDKHNDRCGLDSPSNSQVPNYGATSVHRCLIFWKPDFNSGGSSYDQLLYTQRTNRFGETMQVITSPRPSTTRITNPYIYAT